MTQSNSTGPKTDFDIQAIMDLNRQIRLLDKRVQFREDREAANKEDAMENRGLLVLNPEIEPLLAKMEDPDVHGSVVERNGEEYRVIIDERLRGMRVKDDEGNPTEEVAYGWWIAPPPPLSIPVVFPRGKP